MVKEYSIEVCKELEERFCAAELYRPMRISRYDAGTELTYNVTGIEQANTARLKLSIEKFVGGGFAGQVYKVKVLEIDPVRNKSLNGVEANDRPTRRGARQGEGLAVALEARRSPIEGLEAGKVYAMKILIPPSGFARLFRNFLYWVGFQGPFQLQVNPPAARAGALWQKFIRRAAKIRFGDESAVVDIYATFMDDKLGSCGELSEWIEGRTWRLEVDEHLDVLKRWLHRKAVGAIRESPLLGSPEYRAKRQFMTDFVKLLHDMGAYELARQYEWSTCKSQPNCLKRYGTDDNPFGGLVAVDFRAGLALLPFLPMSPGDFKLIAKGIIRGSLVQFDRSNINKLETFIQAHSNDFANMHQMLEELKADERIYRDSVPDITHNHIRLLYSRNLWSTILDSAITGWKVRNLVDEEHKQQLHKSRILTLLYLIIGVIPFVGTFIRRICGRADWRKHYRELITSWKYFWRSIQARIAEKVIVWHRAGRVGTERALELSEQSWRYFCHMPLSILPAGLHRFITDREFRKEKLIFIFVRPFKLYFNAELREQWLREMVAEGQKKHILTNEDSATILSQINEPYIQKYLISLVVHLMTLPVSEIVIFSLTIAYVFMRPELSWSEAWKLAVGIFAIWQVIPVSPGSLIRGFYVISLIVKERNFKDYNIAFFLAFFRVIGYLAFPIQMAYRYPALSRFMAAHWATEAVHIVPVFGERGALMEHWVFRLFYNWPLTIRRRMRKRAEIRLSIKPRYWHVGLCALAGVSIFGIADFVYLRNMGKLPALIDIWWLAILVPLFCGAGVTLGCGGATLGKRIIAAVVCGVVVALLYSAISAGLGQSYGTTFGEIAKFCFWRIFIFTILSTLGALFTELELPELDSE